MKIAIRAGHNFSVPGAKGIIEETKEARYVKDAVVKYLKLGGAEVFDVTPDDSYNSVNSDLVYGVNEANNLGVDLFVSCHFNNAYNHYDGPIGTEVWTYNKIFQSALRIVNKLSSLGFKNRGVKHSQTLYELRATKMQAMIIEVCFVEATKDVELYKQLGTDKIGKAIAEGILNKIIDENQEDDLIENENISNKLDNADKSNDKQELWEKSISGVEVKNLQEELNRQFNAGLKVDGYFGVNTLNACVTIKNGAKGRLTKLVQERLIAKGYDLSPYGADGVFGLVTVNAVKKLQKDAAIAIDGVVTRNTWKALYTK